MNTNDSLSHTPATPRRLTGTVVSNKMNKTAVVTVVQQRLHPRVKKYFKRTKKFKAHDERNEYQVGDAVIIEETRPLSRDKRWRVVGRAA